VLVRGAGRFPRVGLIENAHREQPQHRSRQENDAVASSLDGTPSQGLKNTDGAEPANYVVANIPSMGGGARSRGGIAMLEVTQIHSTG